MANGKIETNRIAIAFHFVCDNIINSLPKIFRWIILFYFAIPSLPGWAIKNWLPTLFAQNLELPMSSAGPLSTITIAASSFLGVILGGILSDRWVQKNIRGRIYTSAIGLGLTIPALLFLGFGNSLRGSFSSLIAVLYTKAATIIEACFRSSGTK